MTNKRICDIRQRPHEDALHKERERRRRDLSGHGERRNIMRSGAEKHDVHAIAFDCDSFVGSILLRYRNRKAFECEVSRYEEYQKTETVKHFTDSYYYSGIIGRPGKLPEILKQELNRPAGSFRQPPGARQPLPRAFFASSAGFNNFTLSFRQHRCK